jgi:hypothetical protein
MKRFRWGLVAARRDPFAFPLKPFTYYSTLQRLLVIKRIDGIDSLHLPVPVSARF